MGERRRWCPHESWGRSSSDPVTDPSVCGCAAARGERNAGRQKAWSLSTERGKGDLQQKDQPLDRGRDVEILMSYVA